MPTNNTIATNFNSKTLAETPKTVAPPIHISKLLNQQQEDATIKLIKLQTMVFLIGFIEIT